MVGHVKKGRGHIELASSPAQLSGDMGQQLGHRDLCAFESGGKDDPGHMHGWERGRGDFG